VSDLKYISESLRPLALPIASLVHDAANARKHNERNLEAIRQSLHRFGQRKPIIVQKKGMIVRAGNGTMEAAKSLGWTHLACNVIDEDSTDATSFAIADNRTAELAEWDEETLASLLQSLPTESQVAAGFDENELNELLSSLTPEVAQDTVPEPPTAPVSRSGDLWLCGEHRVLCGDSTKAEDVGRLMAGNKADLCFTSPPYGAGNVAKLRDHYVKGADKRESFYVNHDDNPDGWIALMRGWFAAGRQYVDAVACNVQMLADNKVDMIEWLHELSADFVDVVVWDKIHGAPQMQKNVLTNSFEFLFIFGGNGSRSIPLASFHGSVSNVFRLDPKGANDNADVHRATMPIAFPVWVMSELFSKSNSVYEPFCGTGTTLIAAEQIGRKCYGMEISPQYVDVIVTRWEKLTGKQATLEATGETFADTKTKREANV